MKLCLLLPFWKSAAGLAALTAIFLGGRYVSPAAAPEPIHFKNVRELNDFAVAQGLFFQSGMSAGMTWNNFYIADHTITFDDVRDLVRRDCGLTPAWRGILWVAQINPENPIALSPESVGGKWRVWGSVLVAGDEELMDRYEERYRIK